MGNSIARLKIKAGFATLAEDLAAVRAARRALGDGIALMAMDLVMPDPQFIHGVTGWLEAAALARTAGLPMSSHTFVEASAQLLCATPTAHWLEVLDAAGGLRRAPLTLRVGAKAGFRVR